MFAIENFIKGFMHRMTSYHETMICEIWLLAMSLSTCLSV